MAECKIKSFNLARAKVFGYKQTLIPFFIAQRSWPYIHNEFQFSDRYYKVSISATLADGANSVRFKFINYTHDLERWDETPVYLTNEQEDKSWRKACDMAGLPDWWLENPELFEITTPNGKKIYKGKNAIPYDKIGNLCHIIPGWQIWKPAKDKIWCTKTVAECIYAGDPDFYEWLAGFKKYIKRNELRPDQLVYMAAYYNQLKKEGE